MAKETSAPNATISDTTEKTALSTSALIVASWDPDMMNTDASTTPNIPAQIPLNKNLRLHPLSGYPHQKPLKIHASLLTNKTVTPPPCLMELERGDVKGRNLNGKGSRTMSTEAFPDNSGKWTKNMTRNLKTFPSLLTTKSNTMTLHMTTSMESQVTLKISKIFNGISNVTRGVMLWFSFTCTISQPHYSSFLSKWTIPITMDY